MKSVMKIWCVLWFIFLCGSQLSAISKLPIMVSAAYSQEYKDAYQSRQDEFDPRKEGIKEFKTKPVTSDKIVLLSALIHTDISEQAPMPEAIQLGFYTEQRAPVSVEIFCEPKLYYVDPLRENWGPGMATFTWPTEIMKRHQIPADDLYARAVLVEQATRTLFPAFFYFRESPSAVQVYEFIVAPLRKMQMQYWIIDADSDSLIITGTEQSIGANKQRNITWDGRDDFGNEVPEGEYLLKLQGTYKPQFGRRRTISVNYRFLHKTKLDE